MSKEKLYTARWFNEEIQEISTQEKVKQHAQSQHKILSELIGGGEPTLPQEEPERPHPSEVGQKLLWCPLATITQEKMPTRGQYAKKYPKGAVVHFTAGRSLKGDSDALNTLRGGIQNGYCYFVISNDGTIFQSFPLDRWGYHCGKSAWPSLGSSLSNQLVGIEVCCAGKLNSSGVSWFGETYPKEKTRLIGTKWQNQEAGLYHAYTPEQEKALIELLVWLKLNNPDVFEIDYILGHDEISPGRKNDPGGSLSVPMSEFRKIIHDGVGSLT